MIRFQAVCTNAEIFVAKNTTHLCNRILAPLGCRTIFVFFFPRKKCSFSSHRNACRYCTLFYSPKKIKKQAKIQNPHRHLRRYSLAFPPLSLCALSAPVLEFRCKKPVSKQGLNRIRVQGTKQRNAFAYVRRDVSCALSSCVQRAREGFVFQNTFHFFPMPTRVQKRIKCALYISAPLWYIKEHPWQHVLPSVLFQKKR